MSGANYAQHKNSRLPAHAGHGFTLLELIVAVSITAILAALAAPSFNDLIAANRARNIASELFSSLLRARSEALTRNANVTLSPKGGDWQNGWQIADPAKPTTFLEVKDAAIKASISGPAGVTYTGAGRVQGNTVPMFVIKVTAGSVDKYQCVSLDLTGRPYKKAASSC